MTLDSGNVSSVRNREVLLRGSLILRRGGARARESRGPDSGPTPDPLNLFQDDINLIVTCFNVVFKIGLKHIFVFFYTLSFVILPTFALWFVI